MLIFFVKNKLVLLSYLRWGYFEVKRRFMWRKVFRIVRGLVGLVMVFLGLFWTSDKIHSVGANCRDYQLIFARGSGEKIHDGNFLEFKRTVSEDFINRLKDFGVSYDFYELGQNEVEGYPAVDPGFSGALGAKISAGEKFKYGESVRRGVMELVKYFRNYYQKCPKTKFILVGYSQGAQVIGTSLEYLNLDAVFYVGTFGDPKLYLPEGFGLRPPACLGNNLSDYRTFVPDCLVNQGYLKGRDPYRDLKLRGKVGAWCLEGDFVCGSKFIFQDLFAAHVSYKKIGAYRHLSGILTEKIAKAQKVKIDPVHDMTVVFDSTGSMKELIDQYKNRANNLAERVLAGGGRVALLEYRDLKEKFWPRKICEDCSRLEFAQGIEKIKPAGGGDERESALSAIKFALNNHDWRRGMLKTIVLVTDAGFHQPDRDGTTLKEVVKRTLEIDPVNIYVITKEDIAQNYQELTSKTGGRILKGDDLLSSTEIIFERPDPVLNLEKFEARPNEAVNFEVKLNNFKNQKYRYWWDLDFDGIFEIESLEPKIQWVYTKPTQGFMQVKVSEEDGDFGTMSAWVRVAEAKESVQPKIIGVEQKNFSEGVLNLKISALESVQYFLAVNDSPLGLTTLNELTIDGIDPGDQILITPINKVGRSGESYVFKLTERRIVEVNPDFEKTKWNLKAPNTGAK